MAMSDEQGRHQDGIKGHFHRMAGLLVTGVGFFWFAKQVGWIPADRGGQELFWPALIVVLGLMLLVGRRSKRH